MTPPVETKGRWSLSLTGKLAQFNLSLLLTLIALVVFFVLCTRSTDPYIATGGAVLVLILFVACVVSVLRSHWRQEPRPDGQTSRIDLEGPEGQKVSICNPPDRFFAERQTQELIRAIVLGYDENLCPDGRVIGKVADQKYERYTEQQKKDFMESHQLMVRGKKQQAISMLIQGEEGNKTEDVPPHVNS